MAREFIIYAASGNASRCFVLLLSCTLREGACGENVTLATCSGTDSLTNPRPASLLRATCNVKTRWNNANPAYIKKI